MTAVFPQCAVETEKQTAHLPVPAVQEIVGQLGKAREPRRKYRLNLDGVACASHGRVGCDDYTVIQAEPDGNAGACSGCILIAKPWTPLLEL